MAYGPGDSIGVVVHNPPEHVAALLKRLGASGERVFSVQVRLYRPLVGHAHAAGG